MTSAISLDEFSQKIAPTLLQYRSNATGILGTSNPNDVSSLVYGYCSDVLESYPAEILFLGISAGVVFGLRLKDGRQLVVKFHSGCGLHHLDRAYDIQERLKDKGVPCAQLVVAPKEMQPNLYVVTHDLFAPGKQASPTRVVCASIASMYANIVSLVRDLPPEGLIRTKADLTSGIFDHLPVPREDIAQLWETSPRAITHGDWRIRNLLFDKDRVSAIFDFDALRFTPELQSLASTAVNFMRSRGRIITINLYPELTFNFFRDTEHARGVEFSGAQLSELRIWTMYEIIIGVRQYKRVPESFLAERIRRFDQAIGSLWPRWREIGEF